jgi:hypothetical protein
MLLFGGLFYRELLPLEGAGGGELLAAPKGVSDASCALQATPLQGDSNAFQEDWIFKGISGSLRTCILKGFDDFAPEQHQKNSYWN